nr:hypothetical protein [Tanacetum cinerariifolium]
MLVIDSILSLLRKDANIRPKVLVGLLSNHEEGETGRRVSRGEGRCRGPRGGNDDHVDELNGQGNDQGVGANGSIKGVNRNIKGVNGGAPDFSTIIAQQIQNLLPAILAQDMSGCSIDQKVKYTAGLPVEEFCPSHEMYKLKSELWNHAWLGMAMLRILI